MRPTRYVGVTRFSVVSAKNSGFKIDSSDRSKYLDELFDWKRLADRMYVFEKLAAPIYQQMADKHDYTHLVQYSPELPDYWKSRVVGLSKKFPCIKPVLVQDEDIVDSVIKHVKGWEGDFVGTFVWFRVDDDDILAVDYIDTLEAFVCEENVGSAISLGTVFSGVYSHGNYLDMHRVHMPMNSQGQAFICRANLPLGIVESPPMLPHHRITQYMPVIVSDLEPHSLWTRHASQDTASGKSRIGARIANLQGELSRWPYANWNEILRKFPTLANIRNSAESANFTLELLPDRWTEVQSYFEGFKSTAMKVDYEVEFVAEPNSSCTLRLEYPDLDEVKGSFPRDEARGDYRRLSCDPFGHGSILIELEDFSTPRKLKVVSDNNSIKLVRLVFTSLGGDYLD